MLNKFIIPIDLLASRFIIDDGLVIVVNHCSFYVVITETTTIITIMSYAKINHCPNYV